MKRRGFLSMMSAAIAVPALPKPMLAASGVAPAAIPTAYPYGLAVFHARSHAMTSVAEFAARMRLPTAQAERLIGRLVKDQFLVAGGAPGTYRAANPYVQRSAVMTRTGQSQTATTVEGGETMMSYLQAMAQRYFAAKPVSA